jgi:hypothetical protein
MLRVVRRGPGVKVMFSAEEGMSGVSYVASVRETRPHIVIERGVSAFGSARSWKQPSDTAAIEVQPPAPFHGIGRWSLDVDERKAWSGSLAVDVPGRGRVSLSAAAFRAYYRG